MLNTARTCAENTFITADLSTAVVITQEAAVPRLTLADRSLLLAAFRSTLDECRTRLWILFIVYCIELGNKRKRG